MKKLVAILIIATLFVSCHPEHSYQAEGTVTGFDLAACVCCGGLILTIDGDPGNYRINALPGMSNEELSHLTLPRRIKLDYQANPLVCGPFKRLEVSRYVFE